jgi:hypothetical protein
MENIMVYKTRVQSELLALSSELDKLTYCHEEWKYFVETYPNVEEEVLPSMKRLLRYDECVNFFSEENIEKRKIEQQLSELQVLTRNETVGPIFTAGVALACLHFVFAMFLIVTDYTFLAEVHVILFFIWAIPMMVGYAIDEDKSNRLFSKRKKELGYVD